MGENNMHFMIIVVNVFLIFLLQLKVKTDILHKLPSNVLLSFLPSRIFSVGAKLHLSKNSDKIYKLRQNCKTVISNLASFIKKGGNSIKFELGPERWMSASKTSTIQFTCEQALHSKTKTKKN